MPKSVDVFITARTLVNTPFIHQGRKKDLGIDCIGIPIYVAQKLALGDFDRFDYPSRPDGTMQKLISEICHDEVLQPGVLLVFKISQVGQHCGIVSTYQNRLGLIHAWDIAGKVVEHCLTRDWIDKVVGCYGLPGVSYD